mgnify:CR=1 FL=1
MLRTRCDELDRDGKGLDILSKRGRKGVETAEGGTWK